MSSNITIVRGNIFNTKAQTIVNTVNCVGVMGKGIALKFAEEGAGVVLCDLDLDGARSVAAEVAAQAVVTAVTAAPGSKVSLPKPESAVPGKGK